MWIAVNHTPFAVERAFVRDRKGGEVWLLAVRATFEVRPDGTLKRAQEQLPVARAASYLGEPGRSSLKYDSDLILTKGCVDLLVHGHAYAPGGRPVEMVDVGVRCGKWAKSLRVHGERVWRHATSGVGLVASRAKPFEKMPITYERAWGGIEPGAKADEPGSGAVSNPVGSGFARKPQLLLERLVPNIEDPRTPIVPGPGPQAPAGFGPLAPHWSPRIGFAGTYDDKWKQSRAPLLPEDFDERFFRAAPPDQQLPRFASDGQVIEFANLTASGRLRIVLPRIQISAETIFGNGQADHEVVLHTVVFEPDHPRVQMVWHSALPCQGREHLLERSIISWEGDLACLAP